jgi:hypothetical protein
VAVRRLWTIGVAKGRGVLRNEFVWSISDLIAPEWGVGDFWVMKIEGDPTLEVECKARAQMDAKRPISITVSMASLNAIPTVYKAPSGFASPLTRPTWGGGYLSGMVPA